MRSPKIEHSVLVGEKNGGIFREVGGLVLRTPKIEHSVLVGEKRWYFSGGRRFHLRSPQIEHSVLVGEKNGGIIREVGGFIRGPRKSSIDLATEFRPATVLEML